MKYKISIIIPIYNVELYLEKCLFSLFNQTIGFNNLEVILVDDCSTDNSKKIIQKYDSIYENIKGFYLDENSGVAGKPRNIGMEHATADYLMFLDPDDVIKEDACEILFNKIEDESVDIVTGVHSIIDNGKEVIFPGLLINSFSNPNDSWVNRKKDLNIHFKDELKISSINELEYFLGNFGLSSKIFRRSFINKNDIKFPEYIPGEDSTFLFNALIHANGIIFLNKIIYCYNNKRDDEDNSSLSFQKDLSRNFGRLDAYLIMLDISIKNDMLYPFVQYLLKSKLTYFTKNFIINNNLRRDDLLKILKKAQPLFKESLHFDENIAQFKELFELVCMKKYNEAIDCIDSLKEANEKITSDKNNKIPKQNEIKVALIMDAFTYNSYKDEFIPIILEPKTWFESFEKYKPDIFFCESAYNGFDKNKLVDGIAIENLKDKPWAMKIGKNLDSKKDFRDEIFKILDYCKEHNIPTIFWNKEDPTSFRTHSYNFIDTALRFDYIFTTSEECIPKYNAKGHHNVFPLMFASNIKLFNPIVNKYRRDDLIVFAGSWYRQFKERCRIMNDFFTKILNSDFELKIYDRVYGTDAYNRIFPEKYNEYRYPSVPFNKMPEVYKESKIGLNINTVVDSYTMFARRIFELMSSNTFVLSNFSKGIYDIFKDNVVYLDKVDELSLTQEEIDEIREKNIYDVLENHTYSKRFQYILDSINFNYEKEFFNVNIIYEVNNVNEIQNIKDYFNSIEYPFKTCIIYSKNNINLNESKDSSLILEEKDLSNLSFDESEFFIFADLNMDNKFIHKSLLHYQYISNDIGITAADNEKYSFETVKNINNVLFNGSFYENIVNAINKEFKVYTI